MLLKVRALSLMRNTCRKQSLHATEILCILSIKHNINEQEAQLSQRDRATLRVVEYLAKSLKITQDHSK